MAESGNLDLKVISRGALMHVAALNKGEGARLCQICAVRIPDGYELTYTFGKGMDLINYRVVVKTDDEVPSITPIYKAAFLYENEIVELFGTKITGILMDYNRHLYRLNTETPFK